MKGQWTALGFHLQRPIDGFPATAELPGNRRGAQALFAQSLHFGGHHLALAALADALGLGAGDAVHLALAAELSHELPDRAHDSEEQAARWRLGLDVLVQDLQSCALRLERLRDRDEVGDAARQAIEARDDQYVFLLNEVEQDLQLLATFALCARRLLRADDRATCGSQLLMSVRDVLGHGSLSTTRAT